MHVCDHRRHRIETLEGQRKIVCRLVKCIDRTCPANHRTVSPEAEAALCLPRSIFGWDVFCWIGHRRFSRHWSVPQIRGELQDSYQIRVSDDAIEDVIARYQPIVEADSHAKVRMRSKVRGLRAIEKDLLAAQRAEELRTQTDGIPSEDRPSEPIAAAATNTNTPATLSSANAVVLDYCTAVKGILNDDQGGPLHPPGIRMVEALQSVRDSLERCLATKKRAMQKTH